MRKIAWVLHWILYGMGHATPRYFKEAPTAKSADDPNQGWGEDFELFGDVDPKTELN